MMIEKYQKEKMLRKYTFEYWVEDGWYIRKIKEIPGIFSQGESIGELEDNIKDAFRLMLDERSTEIHPGTKIKDIALEIA